MISEIFSFNGRMNRQIYLIYSLAIYGFFWLFSIFDPNFNSNSKILLILIIFVFYQLLRIKIKRFHDINRPGTYIFGALVPFYNFYLLYILLFEKGTEGDNIYGEDLLKTKSPKLQNEATKSATSDDLPRAISTQNSIIRKIFIILRNLLLIICVFFLSIIIIKSINHTKIASQNVVGAMALTIVTIFVYHEFKHKNK